jgi:hypothetical protein
MPSKALFLSKLARDVNTTGDLTSARIVSGALGGGGSTTTVYDSAGLLPYVGNTAGDQAFINSNNRLYLWQGAGWYNVALINKNPIISSVTDASDNTTPFTLADDGSTQTIITIVATDSDGDSLTYSVTKGSGFDSIATISQDSSVFTISPFGEGSVEFTTKSADLTFLATDAVGNTATSVNSFTLSFTRWDQNGGTIVMHFPETGDPSNPSSYFETELDPPATTIAYPSHDQWELVNGALVQRTETERYLIHNGNYSQYETNSNNAFSVFWWSIADTGLVGSAAGGGGSANWTMKTTGVDCAGGTSTISFILQDNTWHHYAMISESGSLACKFYRDGTLITDVTMNDNTDIDLLSFALNSIAANSNDGTDYPCAYSDVYLIDSHAAATTDFIPPTRTATFTGF